MRDKLAFAALALTYSVAGFALMREASGAGLPVASWDGYVIAATALMLAARGAEWRRRLMFAACTLGGGVVLEALAALIQSQSSASSPTQSGLAGLGMSLAYPGLVIAWPLVMLVFFVGRDPASMWRRSPSNP